MKLFVATHNAGKLREISKMLPGWEVLSGNPDVEETELTFSGNALLKARSAALSAEGTWVLADDSGLEVEALGSEPGIRSARYAGKDGDTAANNALLLKNMAGVANRKARFVCAMALISPAGEEYLFEGVCEGGIVETPIGEEGFGYDPLFVPDGFDKTFASLPLDVKNVISHRAKALNKVKEFLSKVF